MKNQIIICVGVLLLLVVLGHGEHQPKGYMKKLTKATNDFAGRLYNQLTQSSTGNIFISPLSIATVFTMVYYGAEGKTEEELNQALGYSAAGIEGVFVPSTFRRLLGNVSISNGDSLEIANAIIADEDFDVRPQFKREMQKLFHALVQEVNFSKDGEEIVLEINKWVKSATHGKISNLVERVDPMTAMILLNAVYFKGKWKHPFDRERTRKANFFNNGQDSKKTDVEMMIKLDDFKYALMYGAQIIELPYEGDNISMLIFLPKKRDGLSDLEAQIDFSDVEHIRQQLRTVDLIVHLPKFKARFTKELTGEMRALGAERLFRPGADLGGISPSNKIYVSEVRHKALIDVNEEGTEATGATAMEIHVLSAPVPFIANHPFLYVIVDQKTNLILFMGRVKRF